MIWRIQSRFLFLVCKHILQCWSLVLFKLCVHRLNTKLRDSFSFSVSFIRIQHNRVFYWKIETLVNYIHTCILQAFDIFLNTKQYFFHSFAFIITVICHFWHFHLVNVVKTNIWTNHKAVFLFSSIPSTCKSSRCHLGSVPSVQPPF